MSELFQKHLSELVVLVTIIIFFYKIYMIQKAQFKRIDDLAEAEEDKKVFFETVKQEISKAKDADDRQQDMCAAHGKGINEIIKKQDRQYSSQQHMEKLIDNNNLALTNVTRVMDKLLVVMESNGH